MNNTFYLTEMNILKLENCLYRFILNQDLEPLLINGITTKIVSMMYDRGIDYYYSDLLATSVNVPIKLVDNIYIYNQSQYYKDPLSTLLSKTEYKGTPEQAKQLEKEVCTILETRKKIHTKNNHHKYKRGIQWKYKEIKTVWK